ncbi:MAG: response regulator transcription factor [Cyanothece sp. SIO1E1]|nr:response regulator transcription factor [Cyanothece sp. SIO1E1]
MINILIVDDHKILAQALVDFLDAQDNMKCIGMLHSAQEAIEQVPTLLPDVILMDIGMPGMNGIDCCKALLKENVELKIVGLSTHMEISIVKRLFKAGAKAYVSKATDLKEIPIAIKKVYNGERYIGEVVRQEFMADLEGQKANKTPSASIIPKLTEREKEVLSLIAQEYTTEEIGQTLFISVNTVQTHRKNLISKFGVRNSVGLVLKALELKMI